MKKYGFKAEFYRPETGYIIVAVLLIWACIIGPSYAHPEDWGGDLVRHWYESHKDREGIVCHYHEYADGTSLAWDFRWDADRGKLVLDPPTQLYDPVEPPAHVQVSTPVGTVPSKPASEPESENIPEAEVVVSVSPKPVSEPEPVLIPSVDIILTEIMFHDWGPFGPGHPQWFELYNRGGDGNLKGFTLTFLSRSDGTYTKGGQSTVMLGDFLLKSGQAVIITNKELPDRPWLRNIDNFIVAPLRNLKNQWILTDANGNEIYSRRVKWNYGWGKHGDNNERQSVDIVRSEWADAEYFYGMKWDKGSPGYHVDVVPKAPHLVKPKLVMLWGSLKQ